MAVTKMSITIIFKFEAADIIRLVTTLFHFHLKKNKNVRFSKLSCLGNRPMASQVSELGKWHGKQCNDIANRKYFNESF